jgi:hypothetical protein
MTRHEIAVKAAHARAAKLSPARRKKIASIAAKSRKTFGGGRPRKQPAEPAKQESAA